jgi:hypothetical protein
VEFLEVAQLVIAVTTILMGVWGVFFPTSVETFVGLRAEKGRGRTEIRTVLGGLFIGMGAAPLILGSPIAFKTLGIAYLGMAIIRIPSMLLDRSFDSSNLMSAGLEAAFGVLLLL